MITEMETGRIETAKIRGGHLYDPTPLHRRSEPMYQRDSEDGVETIETKRGGGGENGKFPLQPVKVSDDTIKFRWGTVCGLVPTIGGQALTANLDDSPGITASGSGIIYVKVDLDASYQGVNPTLIFASSVPADADRQNAHHLLATVDYSSGSISTIAPAHKGSIDMASCGGVLNYWDLG